MHLSSQASENDPTLEHLEAHSFLVLGIADIQHIDHLYTLKLAFTSLNMRHYFNITPLNHTSLCLVNMKNWDIMIFLHLFVRLTNW